MKILHVAHCYHPSTGGVQWFFKNVSERLVKDYGDDVTVVTTNSYYGPEKLNFKKIEPNREVINGVKVIRFPFNRWHIKPLQLTMKTLKRLYVPVPKQLSLTLHGPISSSMKKYLLQSDADVVGASSSNYLFMRLPLWKKCHFFYYGSIHFPQDEQATSLAQIQLNSIKASNYYLANTQYEKERLLKLGVPGSKVFILGTGVDVEQLQAGNASVDEYRTSLGLPTSAVVIGYVGRLEKTKNVMILLEAFSQAATKDANLFLLLNGASSNYVADLKAYASALPPAIANRIIWNIDFPAMDKAKVFNAIDVLVLPSNNESFGLVFLEAWACKKPVIGAAIGAVQNVITDNEDGLLMNINDQSSLEKKILRLASESALRQRMGEKGYEKVMNNYTWDIITKKLRQCYVDAVNSNVNV
jgi:glycosyltransferase involved in cell wall biosynthesis